MAMDLYVQGFEGKGIVIVSILETNSQPARAQAEKRCPSFGYLETSRCCRFSLTYAPSTLSIRDTRAAYLDRLLTVNFATTLSVNINVPVIHMNVSLLSRWRAPGMKL